MSIAPFDAQMIVREHCLRPLPDTVHLIGRQTVLLTEAEAVSLLRAHGLTPAPRAVALDQDTFGAKVAGGRGYISDTSFFGLLGVSAVHAIDHSDYEGADIIIDLNEPLPEAYGASADFIYGGSVLDNIFDPATYMKNIACLLRPDGRLIDGNVCSFHHHPYVLVPPAWYFDYYAINHFTDCKVYVVETGDPLYVYGLTVKPGDPLIQDFGNGSQGAAVGVVVIAEKGRDSTWNHVPSQDQYRSDGEWQRWREGVEHIQRSLRVYHNYGSLTEREFECRPPRRLKSFQFLGKFRPDEQWDFNPAQYAALELEGKPSIAGIRIVKATYGWNNATSALQGVSMMPLCQGNVTDLLANRIDGLDRCELLLDVEWLGDPAPGCAKDLEVLYYYVDDPDRRMYRLYIPSEAHGKMMVIPPLGENIAISGAAAESAGLRRTLTKLRTFFGG